MLSKNVCLIPLTNHHQFSKVQPRRAARTNIPCMELPRKSSNEYVALRVCTAVDDGISALRAG